MKKLFDRKYSIGRWVLTALIPASLCLVGCKENIDDSDLYTFTGEMMTDHFENEPETYSSYLQLLEKVKPGKKSSSTVAALLRARGNYTCFAPTNEAMALYVDSLYSIGELTSTNLADMPDSIAQDIVYNSIIDNGNNDAYLSTSFEEGVLASNMNDRPMTITFSANGDEQTAIYVNTKSRLINKDIELENGVLHVVDRVIAPSNDMIGGLIANTENTKVFGALLTYTGWSDSMTLYRDNKYEDIRDEKYASGDLPGVGTEAEKFVIPQHRYIGYTCFVETDDVFATYGIHFDENNPTSVIEQLKQVLVNKGVYPGATTDDNYKDTANIINQFVAYHLLPMRVPYNHLAIHYNEYGYNNGAYSINTFEYYETMGPWRRLMKITSGPTTGGFRINRYAKMNKNTYREVSVEREGILIAATNDTYESNALNGYYYPISDLLLYDADVPNKVLNERLRFDVASLLKELVTNNLRRPAAGTSDNHNTSFPDCYFDDITFTDVNNSGTTVFTYLPGTNSGWQNYQGDEFNVVRQYDFTMKLPPVPYAGTYELRFACNNNSNVRSMAQFYIGEDKKNLAAVGVPIDLRISAASDFVGYTTAYTDANLKNDNELIEEHDRLMSNNGYMKAPKYFTPAVGGSTPARDYQTVFRKIIYTGEFEPQKTYYIRFKSVLESTTMQFVMDYIELCPKSVYNGLESEDRW